MGLSLRSPNIVRVLDEGEEGDRLYIVMELMDHSLADVISSAGRPLDQAFVKQVLVGIGQALTVLEEFEAVHRDLSPNAVLFTAEGMAKLGDFGISYVSTATMVLGGEHGYGGKPAYMSSEHFHGSIDIRSDMYSLGIVAFEMLTGHLPFDGQSPYQLMYHHERTTLPALPPNTADNIETVIERLTAKKPSDRFQHPAEFINVLEGAAVVHRRGDPPTEPHPPVISLWAVVGALATLIAVVIASAIAAAMLVPAAFPEILVVVLPVVALVLGFLARYLGLLSEESLSGLLSRRRTSDDDPR